MGLSSVSTALSSNILIIGGDLVQGLGRRSRCISAEIFLPSPPKWRRRGNHWFCEFQYL